MQIELPQDIVERVRLRTAASQGITEADVIRRALDSLDLQERERLAIQEGIDAWRSGDSQELDEFDADFRSRHRLPARE